MAPLRLRIPPIEAVAVPGVCILIFFLAYTSQYLFYFIDPGPLSRNQALWFNGFVLGIWWCYNRACTIDPGPKGWVERIVTVADEGDDDESEGAKLVTGIRWCKKCKAPKPPRAHHCRKCGRCIPKMDHHCPWTANCVSHLTFPHFIRFVLYAVISMSVLTYHLATRVLIIWGNRNLPAYLGPPVWAIAHLMVLLLLNGITLFALSILLTTAIHSLAINTSMIESWEIERHEALVDRSRKSGGYVYANGQKMRVERQEFPYDIGIWKNICQGMGSSNVLMWILPFGGGPSIGEAANWEVNGFEDESKVWPPPDPDKIPRDWQPSGGEAQLREYGSPSEEMEAFRRRQEKDYQRWGGNKGDKAEDDGSSDETEEYEEGMDGEEGWTNSDGDRLRDYGVDEEAEMLADDDIPLGELLRRRKAKAI